MGSDLLRAFGVNQTAAGHHNLAYLRQIFTLLHKDLSHHGIGFFNGAGMTGNRFLYSKRCQRKVQRLQLFIAVRNLIGVGF